MSAERKMSLWQRLRGNVRAATTTLRSPASWFWDALGYREVSSGVVVSEAVALSLSPYYCGLNMIAGTISTLPLNVYKRGEGRRREPAPQHAAHYLLHSEPNPEMSAVSFREVQVQAAIARGNAYAEIQRDGNGRPLYLWPLPSHMTCPRRDVDGALWYEVRLESGEPRYLRPQDVLHVPGLGWDGLQGYGLLRVAAEAIGLNAAQDRYAGKFFKNGGNVSAVLETDATLTDPAFQRLQSEIANKLTGLSNAHRVAILEAGLKLKPTNPTHADAQLIEGRRFSVEEWARWFNLPPHKLKEMSHATFSNVEHQNIEFVVDSIRPWMVKFEAEYNRKLFPRSNMFYAKHVVDGLLRGDTKSRYEAYAIARSWGWMSANDVLELEDRNPLAGDMGDVYLIPMNMARADGKPLVNDAAGLTREQALTQAAARRLVNYERRRQKSEGRDAVYDGEFSGRLREWLETDDAVAGHYLNVAQQLNLIANDVGASASELAEAKVLCLMNLVNKAHEDTP